MNKPAEPAVCGVSNALLHVHAWPLLQSLVGRGVKGGTHCVQFAQFGASLWSSVAAGSCVCLCVCFLLTGQARCTALGTRVGAYNNAPTQALAGCMRCVVVYVGMA